MLLNMIALATSHDEAYKKEARTPLYLSHTPLTVDSPVLRC